MIKNELDGILMSICSK